VNKDSFRRASQDSKHGDLSFPLLRFDNEVHRLYGVLNLGLFNKRYLAADDYTIADNDLLSVGVALARANVDLEEFPKCSAGWPEVSEPTDSRFMSAIV